MAKSTPIVFSMAIIFILSMGLTLGADTREAGEQLVRERCVACHDLSRVESADKSREEWASTVNTMRRYGAQVSDQEQSVIVDYLSTKQIDP